ncbi:hypothetical protein LP415_00470 [Polaromonas sp. P1(28)-8]|nr:hypothetical protein LP415_00470 [Polaromonas sp. P1(28)-8]
MKDQSASPARPAGARRLGCAARQVKHCGGGKQAARQDLQREAIHGQTEHHRAGHQRDRCSVPGRDRHQGPQCLRPVARTQAPGGGQHPAGGRVQPMKGADPCHHEPRPKA